MNYTVNKLAKLAGVSVRTLHHYDRMGLLKPEHVRSNGYRQYGEKELLKLQQILFFRELDFSLAEIGRILSAENFDMRMALRDQRKMIELKKKRLTGLIQTIDRTINKLNNQTTMEDQELYGAFSKEEGDKYAAEAKERWGNTEAYKQSQQRVKKMTKADWDRISKESEAIIQGILANMEMGAESVEVQGYIAQHYNSLRNFYEPNLEMYRGLGQMYLDDVRFAAYYEKYQPGLAVFMRDAIVVYCDEQEKNKLLVKAKV